MGLLSHLKTQIYLLLILLVICAWCDRTSLKIYVDVTGYQACFRRLNATHQIGCASKQGGNTGVLHYIEEDTSLTWLLNKGPHQPYVVLLTPNMFNRETVEQLQNSGKISGILVDFSNKSDVPQSFSADHTCPNDGYGIYKDNPTYASCKQVVWNAKATSLMFFDFNMPVMVLTNATEVQYLIENCYTLFNKPNDNDEPRDYPLCAAQAKDAMFAAKDTPTCMRRTNLKLNLNPVEFCDPLGDVNLIAFSRAFNSSQPVKSNDVILAAARLDAFTMFNQISGGADSPISGIVALLGAVHALNVHAAEELEDPSNRPILYSLFNGEAFDYIGSSRMVYDMLKGEFPFISLDHVGHIIELSQVGMPSDDDYSLWMHTDPISNSNESVKEQVNQLKDNLKNSGSTVGLDLKDTTILDHPLPPASAQQFLKKKDIPTVVLADHDQEFTNLHYNSRFDLAAQIDAQYPEGVNGTDRYNFTTAAAFRLQKLATSLAQTLYKLSTNNSAADHIVADNITITNLLYCILFRPNCDLFKAAMDPTNANALAKDTDPYDLYVGVYSDTKPNRISFVLRSVLGYLSGKKIPDISEDDCKKMGNENKLYRFTWIRGPNYNESEKNGICMRSSAYYHFVQSPAFDIEDYDYNSHEYSTWTESRWANDAMKLRVFLVPSREREIGTLMGGIAMLLVSLAGGYLLKLRGSLLFRNVRMPYD